MTLLSSAIYYRIKIEYNFIKYQVKVRSTDTILDVKEKLIALRAKQEDGDKKRQEFPFEKPDDFEICWQVGREENKDASNFGSLATVMRIHSPT